VLLFFWFDLFLEARAEILKKISLVFWSKRWHQKDILKLTDLYFFPIALGSNSLWSRIHEIFSELLIQLLLVPIINYGYSCFFQEISSPNFPSNYPPNINCRWVLVAPSTSKIHLHFLSMNMEGSNLCSKDSLTIGTSIC